MAIVFRSKGEGEKGVFGIPGCIRREIEKNHPHRPFIKRGADREEMKLILKLFGRTDGSHTAFDVMVVDAKKILGFRAMPTFTHA